MILDCVVDLRRGIESGEIVPYYQPLTELRTGQLIGFEVLARWKHPLRGMVPPDEFIRMAEDAGCIEQLMEKVLGQAFRAMQRLPEYLRLNRLTFRRSSCGTGLAAAGEPGGGGGWVLAATADGGDHRERAGGEHRTRADDHGGVEGAGGADRDRRLRDGILEFAAPAGVAV